MKTIKYLFLMLLIALCSMNVTAQQRNILQVPDVTTQIGNAQLPVSIENTDEIAGVQFDLTLPKSVTAEQVGIIANRGDGHSVTVSQLSSGAYRVMLHSPQNRPLRGQSGVVMYLPITIPASFEGGSEHPLAISNAVLGKATGENVLTEAIAGSIRISKLPDLTVKNITCDEQMLSPGDHFVCSWQVENIGEIATGSGWSEQVSLISEDGTLSKLVATIHCGDILDASGIVSRRAEITLPTLLGIDGQARLQVRIVPDSNTGESTSAQGNNTLKGTSLLHVNKILTLEMSPNRVDENSGRRIALRVNRSGQWTVDETFKLSATGDSRLSVPSSITIPAGQSGTVVYLTVTDNDVVDDTSDVTMSVEGNDYPAAVAHLTIDDNELPDLQVTASKSVVNEGETFQLTITASRVATTSIELTLTSENDKRFTYPRKVTIPAGQKSVTVDVTAKDDDVPSETLSNAFTVSAPRYENGEAIVLLEDDDMPVLQLTLTPNKIVEGAGPVSVTGTLRRTGVTTNKITIRLTDDSNGGLYFGTRELVLNKGVEEVNFNFGPIDNTVVDGDRIYTVTAVVWLSSCSCSAAGESAGSVSAQLQVLDNDGPALNLTSSLGTIKEGGTTTLTVSRNTMETSNPLTITLISDYEEGLTYNHTVTIPAGQQSAMIEVTAIVNDIQGDSRTVVFTVKADGYATGTCYMMVTNQTLPDAVITDFRTNVSEIEIGHSVDVSLVVVNKGAAPFQAGTNVTVYANSNTVGLKTSKVLGIGESEALTTTLEMPNTIEEVRCYAVVNEKNSILELNYNNNTSASVVVKTLSPFTASVSTDKTVYKQGEKIIISGKIVGNQTEKQTIEVYILYENARMAQTAQTDANGTFSIDWMPYTSQSGHFGVGACYQGENLKEEMASFDIYGLKRSSNDYITCEAIVGEPYTGNVSFENPGKLSLTNVSVQLLSAPDYCDVKLNMPSVINGGEKVLLDYTIDANAATTTNTWEQIKARITTNEGVSLDVLLYVFARNAVATLYPSTQKIKTTMVKGQSREYSMTITNIGKGKTGDITLSLPDWMTSASGTTLASLSENETTAIVLKFTPNDNMYLNIPVTGCFGINCENGNGIVINYDITPVSETVGTLIVDATDVYTYNTTEAPHVSGAKVEVRSPYTNDLVAQGETDENGLYTMVLPEGYYELRLSSDKHENYSDYIIVDPGTENRVTAILKFEAITVNWSVTETEVEDEYDIVTTIKHETNVPMPVVVLDMPEKVDAGQLGEGESLVFYATLTNKGLIAAQDAALIFPEHLGFTFEPLTQNTELTIAPQQSVVIPVKLTRNSSTEAKASRRAMDIDISCGIRPVVFYFWECGNDRQWHQYSVTLLLFVCDITDNSNFPVPDIKKKEVIPPPPPITISVVVKDDEIVRDPPRLEYKGCEPCQNRILIKLTQCVASIIPVAGCASSGAFCAESQAQGKHDWRTNTTCTLTAISCVSEATGVGELWQWIPDIISCLISLTEPCNLESKNSARSRADGIVINEPSYIVEFRQKADIVLNQFMAFKNILIEIFGDEKWVNETTLEEQYSLLLDLATSNGYLTIEQLISKRPKNITEEQFAVLIDRLNNTTKLDNGQLVESDNYIHQSVIDENWNIILQIEQSVHGLGYPSVGYMWNTEVEKMYEKLQESSSSVCASISLQLNQTMTLTRQAFRGTLTVFNGNEDTPMKDVKLFLNVINRTIGQVATSHEFQINAESLNGFTGELNLDSGWTLEANETGTATILFIPTKYAAPMEPTEWSFGGTLSYIDPFTGLEVTRELFPVTLTVKPSPDLELTYLMQRNVYGDDPLTLDVVEPMKPAEFALIINNNGYGEAKNVRLLTEQPKIVDNEKGLLIDFSIISSQVNGQAANLSFGQTIANDFGTIPAHSQAYAQWWLESSLLGHFTSYEVEATHVTNYGNADLSLVDTVTIHEMIHGFTFNTMHPTLNVPLRGYLVNDIVDADDLPDAVYFTDALRQDLYIAQNDKIDRLSENEYLLNVMPSQEGWNYGSVTDPTHGRQKLTKIVRKSDGVEIPVDNIWQTDRTLLDGKDWLYENRLHFVGNIPADGETFVLTFEPKPELELAVESYTGVPEDGTVLKEQLTTVTVKFNKPIKAETFTTEDITLYCQGIAQDASQIVIEKQNEQEYKLILNDASLGDGYYVLTVQTAGIEDNEGFNGSTGKQISWIQYVDGKVALIVNVSPAEGGTVTPESGRFIYDSDVILKATPAEGYIFSKWMIGNETVSTDAEFTYHLYKNTELTALFKESVFTGLQPVEGDALHVTITPLPLRDNMFVSGNFKEIQHVSIYDMRGMKCLGLDNILSGQGIYVSNLKTGIYYVQIVTDRGLYRTKVIKR